MKIIDKTIELSMKMFEHDYQYRDKYRTFHYAFAVRKNSIIGYGSNSYKEDSKIYKIGNLLNNYKQKTFKNRHAEIDLLLKIKDNYLNNIKVVSLRVSKSGLQNSKPCIECEKTLRHFGLKKIYYISMNQLCYTEYG